MQDLRPCFPHSEPTLQQIPSVRGRGADSGSEDAHLYPQHRASVTLHRECAAICSYQNRTVIEVIVSANRSLTSLHANRKAVLGVVLIIERARSRQAVTHPSASCTIPEPPPAALDGASSAQLVPARFPANRNKCFADKTCGTDCSVTDK